MAPRSSIAVLVLGLVSTQVQASYYGEGQAYPRQNQSNPIYPKPSEYHSHDPYKPATTTQTSTEADYPHYPYHAYGTGISSASPTGYVPHGSGSYVPSDTATYAPYPVSNASYGPDGTYGPVTHTSESLAPTGGYYTPKSEPYGPDGPMAHTTKSPTPSGYMLGPHESESGPAPTGSPYHTADPYAPRESPVPTGHPHHKPDPYVPGVASVVTVTIGEPCMTCSRTTITALPTSTGTSAGDDHVTVTRVQPCPTCPAKVMTVTQTAYATHTAHNQTTVTVVKPCSTCAATVYYPVHGSATNTSVIAPMTSTVTVVESCANCPMTYYGGSAVPTAPAHANHMTTVTETEVRTLIVSKACPHCPVTSSFKEPTAAVAPTPSVPGRVIIIESSVVTILYPCNTCEGTVVTEKRPTATPIVPGISRSVAPFPLANTTIHGNAHPTVLSAGVRLHTGTNSTIPHKTVQLTTVTTITSSCPECTPFATTVAVPATTLEVVPGQPSETLVPASKAGEVVPGHPSETVTHPATVVGEANTQSTNPGSTVSEGTSPAPEVAAQQSESAATEAAAAASPAGSEPSAVGSTGSTAENPSAASPEFPSSPEAGASAPSAEQVGEASPASPENAAPESPSAEQAANPASPAIFQETPSAVGTGAPGAQVNEAAMATTLANAAASGPAGATHPGPSASSTNAIEYANGADKVTMSATLAVAMVAVLNLL